MLNNLEIDNAQNALWFGLFPAQDIYKQNIISNATLDKIIEYPHITFGYKIPIPENIPWNFEFDILINGYGNDRTNEGFKVEIPNELQEFYFGAEIPHITISMSVDGSAVNTGFIDFTELDENEKFVIPMVFGYYMNGQYYF